MALSITDHQPAVESNEGIDQRPAQFVQYALARQSAKHLGSFLKLPDRGPGGAEVYLWPAVRKNTH
jgi:hypothetical protein